ncbi:hypothetical protein [Brevundimonas sp.]|uniref:hypothetical protein n=1 Tax=Brevundimonas sp. TaxID=1871086 RepID=UPI002D632022|nr:hypothetical protein [Brevundimonas sp.]HYC98499.1 hypothetical protein [Brevundimonas sp.]
MTMLDQNDAARSFPGFASNGDAQSGRTLRQRTARPLSEERLTVMSRTTGKRGFVPAQATASVQSLDFAAAAEAFRAAVALDGTATSEAENDATADLIAERADRLIGVPASDPAQIAEKVNAFLWLHGCTSGNLSDPATQRRIATSQNEPAKGLLALYLDLTALADARAVARAGWDSALAAYEAAQAMEDAVTEAEKEIDHTDVWSAANAAKHRALEALLMTRAPDAQAMGEKARLAIINLHASWRGDEITDPAFISRLLAGEAEEVFVASIYQDGLALAGCADATVVAEPDPFDAEEWLADVETRTGSMLTPSDSYGNAEFEGGDATTAAAERNALHPSHEFGVTQHACARAKSAERERARHAPPPVPAPPVDLRPIFINGLLNTFEDAERDDARAKLAAIGLEAR